MYKSIENIELLRSKKHAILKSVYQETSLEKVCENQSKLGSMAISIFTDVSDVLLPALNEDGVNNLVWSKISMRLERLSFVNVPTAAEIKSNYKRSMENPVVVQSATKALPKPGEKVKVRKLKLPGFLALLAAQGISIPLILGEKLALVKVINAAAMVVEIVVYFNWFSKIKSGLNNLLGTSDKSKKSPSQNNVEKNNYSKTTSQPTDVHFEQMCKQAFLKVYKDNKKSLDDWFDKLVQITTEEIDKALRNARG